MYNLSNFSSAFLGMSLSDNRFLILNQNVSPFKPPTLHETVNKEALFLDANSVTILIPSQFVLISLSESKSLLLDFVIFGQIYQHRKDPSFTCLKILLTLIDYYHHRPFATTCGIIQPVSGYLLNIFPFSSGQETV